MIPLLLLFGVTTVARAGFQPLRILVIQPENGILLPAKLDRALLTAVSRIQDAVNVAPLLDHTVLHDDVLKCLELDPTSVGKGSARTVSREKPSRSSQVALNKNIQLNRANFAIVIEVNQQRCVGDIELMASANPCYVRNGQRPVIARMRVCPQLDRWQDFLVKNTAVDVFRHELLHGLGWGTIISSPNLTFIPADVNINWNSGTSNQPITRSFMAFAQTATEFARSHFKCSQLEGIEAEWNDRVHLSEYIFGNELMTPVISQEQNFFTEVSARILESTHLGSEMWYRVDRSVIYSEAAAYSYGRGWGCEFTSASCYDYINLRLRQRRSTFPFCSGADYGGRSHSLQTCAKGVRQQLKCDSMPLESHTRSANGLIASTILQMFPGISDKYGFRMASGPETRFCPFVEAISGDNRPFTSPPLEEITSC